MRECNIDLHIMQYGMKYYCTPSYKIFSMEYSSGSKNSENDQEEILLRTISWCAKRGYDGIVTVSHTRVV